MIEGTWTYFSTEYTVLKNAQIVNDVLEKLDVVITCDVAFYMQAEQIQIKFSEEFSNTAVCL